MYLEALITVSCCQNNSVPTTHLIATSRLSPICKWPFQSGSFLNKPKYPKKPQTRNAGRYVRHRVFAASTRVHTSTLRSPLVTQFLTFRAYRSKFTQQHLESCRRETVKLSVNDLVKTRFKRYIDLCNILQYVITLYNTYLSILESYLKPFFVPDPIESFLNSYNL